MLHADSTMLIPLCSCHLALLQEVSYEELTAPRGVRPKTTSAVAKRLLSHALNRPELRDREAERQLAAARRQNQQERRERQQQAAAVWDDP